MSPLKLANQTNNRFEGKIIGDLEKSENSLKRESRIGDLEKKIRYFNNI